MIKMNTLDEWLSYLESMHPTEIDLGLDRIKQVADRLSLFPLAREVIMVAGTNGKGTTCAYIESYASQLGKSSGVYSSPHLIRFNERIRIRNEEVGDQPLLKAFECVEAARKEISLTYFEFTTLAAFWLFKQADLDVAILEVGLGGRLDAVNIVDADVSVVTSIGIDHESWLGSDIDVIGFEKAGIFRSGRPAVFGASDGPASVGAHATQIGAEFYQAGNAYQFDPAGGHWTWSMKNGSSLVGLSYPGFPVQNVAAALCAMATLNWSLNRETANRAVEQVSIRGRMEAFEFNGVEGWLDVAHNPQAAAYLAEQLTHKNLSRKPVAIIGCMSDKDISGVIKQLESVFDRWLCIDLPIDRALSSSELKDKLINCGQAATAFSDFQQAFETVAEETRNSPEETRKVVVLGSFFTVAEAISYYER